MTVGQEVRQGRLLRILVSEPGKPETNVKIPIGLARWGMQLGARYAAEDLRGKGIDVEQLLKEVDTVGQIADITNEGRRVQIFVE